MRSQHERQLCNEHCLLKVSQEETCQTSVYKESVTDLTLGSSLVDIMEDTVVEKVSFSMKLKQYRLFSQLNQKIMFQLFVHVGLWAFANQPVKSVELLTL